MTEFRLFIFSLIIQKKPRRDGGHEPGLPVPYGGTCDEEGNPITELCYDLVLPYSNNKMLLSCASATA